MEEELHSTEPNFWSQRYSSAKTPWKIEHVPERLHAFIRSLEAGSNILIPGCGDDFRPIAAFDRAGHSVTAIDFSPVAVERARRRLPQLRDRIILADFFSYDFGAAMFDVVYERTFLCALPPRLWNEYAARVAELLRPHGVLAGFFFYGEEPDPPPFPLTESSASEIFGGRFHLRKSEGVSDSLPIYDGNEIWQQWQRGAEPV